MLYCVVLHKYSYFIAMVMIKILINVNVQLLMISMLHGMRPEVLLIYCILEMDWVRVNMSRERPP